MTRVNEGWRGACPCLVQEWIKSLPLSQAVWEPRFPLPPVMHGKRAGGHGAL